MLGKLLKYEFKAMAKYFLPIYVVVLLMSPLVRIFINLDLYSRNRVLSIIPVLITVAYALAMISLVILTEVFIILRFYKSMVTEEGYLYHTLPVTPSQHIFSKLIASFTFSFISMAVFCLSILLLIAEKDSIHFLLEEIHEFIDSAWVQLGIPSGKITMLFILVALIMVASVVKMILFSYASLSIGQVISSHRIIGAIAAAFILNILSSIVSAVVSLPAIYRSIKAPDDAVVAMDTANTMMIVGLASTLAFIVIYFIITNFILKKKLNLE